MGQIHDFNILLYVYVAPSKIGIVPFSTEVTLIFLQFL